MSIEVQHQSDFFTPTEKRVISLWWAGNTTDKGIAKALKAAPDTVRKHFKHILHKLGMPYGSRRDQAMIKALEAGLIDIRRQASGLFCLLLTCFSLYFNATHQADDYARLGKLRRNPVVRTTRQRRNSPFDNLLAQLQDQLSL